MFTARKFLGVGLALGLIVGLTVGAGAARAWGAGAGSEGGAAGGRSAVAVGTSTREANVGTAQEPFGVPVVGLSATVGAAGTMAAGGTAGVGAAQSAIAWPYPVYVGAPAPAPARTIVVTGVGEADLNADGSNRAAAEQTALSGALADAKHQATVIADVSGVTISGVLSVSASVAPGPPVPLAPLPAQPPIYEPTHLEVAVTVEYGIS